MRTLFLRADAAWSYGRGEATARRFAPASEWLAAHAGGNVRLVLSGTLTHQIVATDPALPIEDDAGLLAWARQQFVHYHGPAAERWPLAGWLLGSQRGASAAHGIDLDALLRGAREQQLRLRAVQPWWAVALQVAASNAPTLALAAHAELWLVEGIHLTRVVCASGRVDRIEQHWLERPDGHALAARLVESQADGATTRWVLGYGLATEGPDRLPARCLGRLDTDHPAAGWLGC